MEKLNICLVSLTFAPDSQDGAAKFFTGIFNYLKNQGHNVKLITGKWNIEFSDPDIYQINIIIFISVHITTCNNIPTVIRLIN